MIRKFSPIETISNTKEKPKMSNRDKEPVLQGNHLGEDTMKARAAPIPFAGSMLGRYRHVCAFFSSTQEEYGTLLPFVRDGLERGERGYHVLPSQYREEHLDQLRRAGIDVAAAPRRGPPAGPAPPET